MPTHTEIPAIEGPAYCTGCGWESRQTGLNSHAQFIQHLQEVRES